MGKRTRASGPIGVGIVGLGRAGWGMHGPELKSRTDKFAIVAAADLAPARCDAMAAACGCKTYGALEDLLRDPAVELVSIATRSPDHVAHALLALRAGKRVFLEKPVALNARDAQRLLAASRRYPNRLFLRHNRRFERAFRHIRELIDSGILGTVYAIKLHRHGYQRRDDWQTLVRCGGGQLNNWGPHIIDHALQLLDAPVADIWADLKRVAAVGDAEDHFTILLRGRNARTVTVEISGGVAIAEPEYVVFGTKGALVGGGNELRLRYLDPAVTLPPRTPVSASPPMTGSFGSPDTLAWKEEVLAVAPADGGDMDQIWDHLYAAIRGGKPFPITVAQGVAVVRVTDRVRQLAQVRVPQAATSRRGKRARKESAT